MNEPGDDSRHPLRWLRRFERVAAAGLVALVLGLMAAQVIARYVFGSPIPWSEEVACFAFVWLAFLGGAMVAGEGRHLTVDVVSPLLGRRGRLVFEWLAAAIVTACCLLMIVGAAPFVHRLGRVASPAAGIARRWWYLASAAGLALVALHAVAGAAAAQRRGQPDWGPPEGDLPPGEAPGPLPAAVEQGERRGGGLE
jgi:TRAP-type transport system small permease protein